MIREFFNDIRAIKYRNLPGSKGYYIEYSEWFNKLKFDNEINFRVLDIGSDRWNTFYHYFKFRGFVIDYYEGYDINYHTIITVSYTHLTLPTKRIV